MAGGLSAELGPFPIEYIGTRVNGAGMGGLLPAVVNIVVLAARVFFQSLSYFFLNHLKSFIFILTLFWFRQISKSPDSFALSSLV